MRCEDYPCCGHTSSDPCPERDKHGRIVVHCVCCFKRLGYAVRSSICAKCQNRMARAYQEDMGYDYE